MKKVIISLFLSIVFLSSIHAVEDTSIAPPKLRFGEDGKFKIVQFTDVHYIAGDSKSKVAIDLIREVLEVEQPHLVVFTGDVAWSKDIKKIFDEVLAPVIEKKICWAFVFGNHDDEHGMSRQQIMSYLIQKPYCLAQSGISTLLEVAGVGNYSLTVHTSKEYLGAAKSVLYFLDSGSYTPIKEIGQYNWFDFSQVQWYRDESKSFASLNDGKALPGLAFFHIPLQEYTLMSTGKDTNIVGSRKEDECDGKLNTGMFAAMRECGDVMGMFVGHDHDNDYIGTYHDIALAYGRYSGGNTVYNNLGLNGCRVIELEEDKREFSTYIRLLGGEKLYEVRYPDSFNKKK